MQSIATPKSNADSEAPIPKLAPRAIVRTIFKRDRTDDQAEQYEHDRKIEARERSGIGKRERREERTTSGKEPHFVTVPHRADAATQDRLLLLGLTKDGIEHTDAKIEAIEHEIHRDQNRDKEEPKSLKNRDIHDYSPSFVAAGAVSSFAEASAAFTGGVPDMNEFEEAATGAGCSCVGPCLMKRATMRAHAMNSTR